ncbi:MAG: chemotaxis protein CheW [Planctomycetota bacterium]
MNNCDATSQASKITRDLQEADAAHGDLQVHVPKEDAPPGARDVSGKAGKPCQLLLEGADTEVDRNVVDKIRRPVVHFKATPSTTPEPGRLRRGGQTRTGHRRAFRPPPKRFDRDLDPRRRRWPQPRTHPAKPAEKGLVPSDGSAQDMPDSAVYKLIFHAGFSTAQAVTDISGRGVGMDVVRKNIESMRGRIDIQSVAGQGTTFLIQLPLTLAIIDAMVVRSNEERYVLPTLSIVQSFQPTPRQVQHLCTGMSLVNIRGQMVPLRGLEDVLHNRRQPVEPGESTLILVESSDQQVCLCVDEIIGQQQVVIKNLGVGSLPCISGGAILGDTSP